jgi:hypothetical protein
MDTTTIINNDDSGSDVSMSEESDEEEEQNVANAPILTGSPTQPDLAQSAPPDTDNPIMEGSKKRKFSDATEPSSGHTTNGVQVSNGIHKRPKPDADYLIQRIPDGHLRKDKSVLPGEIWHHIFTFCPPRVLGQLLQVNKSFNAYLDPASSGRPLEALSSSIVKGLTPDAIWRASRKLLNLPGIPNPLIGRSELDMWKLACGNTCQFCGKKSQDELAVPRDRWHPGPGENGVVPIWSFGIRSCGSCLPSQLTKVGILLIVSFKRY